MSQAKILTIKWQRLLYDGQTCPRCGSTGDEVDKAVTTLRQSLASLGIVVVLEKGELSLAEFKQDTLQSNAIAINGRLLEDWLGAQTGQSECCDVCGPNDCRTLNVAGVSHEVVPAELIVKAGLLAAAQLLGAGGCDCAAVNSQSKNGCCRTS